MKLKTLALVGLLGSYALPCTAANSLGGVGHEAVELKAMCLNEDHIKGFEEKIRNELEWNNNVRFVAKGAGCVAGLAACLMFFNDFSIVTGDELRSMRNCVPVMHAVADHYIFKDNEAVQNALVGIGDKQQSSGGWGSFFGRLACQMAFTSFFGYISQRLMSGIFYDQSVKWFVREKTLFADVEEQLQALKADINNLKLGRALVTQVDCDRYVETILTLHNTVAEQLEQVVAYMGYKAGSFPMTTVGALKPGAAIGGYLKARIQEFSDQLNGLAATYKGLSKKEERIIMIASMFDGLELLISQVASNISDFALVEKKMQKAA